MGVKLFISFYGIHEVIFFKTANREDVTNVYRNFNAYIYEEQTNALKHKIFSGEEKMQFFHRMLDDAHLEYTFERVDMMLI